MSALIHARVVEQLVRLRLRYVAERLDAVLGEAARTEPTYLDFLDHVLREEVEAKQRTRVSMGLKIAHFPVVKTLDEFEFKFQPSVDQRLVRELATGRFLMQADNVLIFGAPGVGKTHLAIALGRAVVEAGHSVLFTSATGLLAALAKAETDGQLADRLMFFSKPKLLIIDELG
jgi:DNA replication protein DnaC